MPDSTWTVEPFDRQRHDRTGFDCGVPALNEYLSTKIGIQAVEVDAINEAAIRFYKKYGFISLKDDSHHLFLPMKVIRKLKLPPL